METNVVIDATELLIQLLYLVLIPVIIGMVLNYYFPQFTKRKARV